MLEEFGQRRTRYGIKREVVQHPRKSRGAARGHAMVTEHSPELRRNALSERLKGLIPALSGRRNQEDLGDRSDDVVLNGPGESHIGEPEPPYVIEQRLGITAHGDDARVKVAPIH